MFLFSNICVAKIAVNQGDNIEPEIMKTTLKIISAAGAFMEAETMEIS
jgi:isocitrate/isopropylmalate dehydrogenase